MLPIAAGARCVRDKVDGDENEEIHLERNVMDVLEFLIWILLQM